MKRDLDLVRAILLEMEAGEHGFCAGNLSIDGYSAEQVAYHCYLLEDGGFINAVKTTSLDSRGPEAIPRHLLWKGHEFLDAARDPGIWAKAKEKSLAIAGGVSVPVMLGLLKLAIKEKLGLDISE